MRISDWSSDVCSSDLEMNWDGQNPAREHGEWLISCIEEAAKLTDRKPSFTFAEPRHFTSADGKIAATVTGLTDATEQLKRLSQPYLDWSGKRSEERRVGKE